jgi:hypothetical protein
MPVKFVSHHTQTPRHLLNFFLNPARPSKLEPIRSSDVGSLMDALRECDAVGLRQVGMIDGTGAHGHKYVCQFWAVRSV